MQRSDTLRAGETTAKWLAVCEQLPEIRRLGNLRSLTTVYYPIALLRMKLEEYSFEDFDTIEQSLLRFYSCGITRAEDIARWMALPSVRYVQERLALLKAEGLIGGGALTDLGRDSLAIGQKKKLYDAEQIFQADGITGLLLPREYQVKENRMADREFTYGMLPHIAPSEAIALSTIREAVEGEEKIRAYKRYRKSILNVNVRQVEDVKVAGIKYVKAMMAWPVSSQSPLVFLPYFKRGEPGKARHCDMPLFVPEGLAGRLPGLAAQVETVPDRMLTGISELYRMMRAELNKQDISGIPAWISRNTSFRALEQRVGERVEVRLECGGRDEKLSPLELEIYAALGSDIEVPVEADMTLPGENGREFRQHCVFWPYADEVPREAALLSENWSEFSRRICKNTPMSLKDAVNYIQKKHSDEEEA